MRAIIITLLVLLLLAGPAVGQGYYHEFTMELDGEWELTQSIEQPEQRSNINLKGVGKAKLTSVLRKAPVWWDLF